MIKKFTTWTFLTITMMLCAQPSIALVSISTGLSNPIFSDRLFFRYGSSSTSDFASTDHRLVSPLLNLTPGVGLHYSRSFDTWSIMTSLGFSPGTLSNLANSWGYYQSLLYHERFLSQWKPGPSLDVSLGRRLTSSTSGVIDLKTTHGSFSFKESRKKTFERDTQEDIISYHRFALGIGLGLIIDLAPEWSLKTVSAISHIKTPQHPPLIPSQPRDITTHRAYVMTHTLQLMRRISWV